MVGQFLEEDAALCWVHYSMVLPGLLCAAAARPEVTMLAALTWPRRHVPVACLCADQRPAHLEHALRHGVPCQRQAGEAAGASVH